MGELSQAYTLVINKDSILDTSVDHTSVFLIDKHVVDISVFNVGFLKKIFGTDICRGVRLLKNNAHHLELP